MGTQGSRDGHAGRAGRGLVGGECWDGDEGRGVIHLKATAPPDVILEANERMRAVTRAASELCFVDLRVIQLRFDEELTLAAIGRIFGKSRERVRQMVVGAVKRLRDTVERHDAEDERECTAARWREWERRNNAKLLRM